MKFKLTDEDPILGLVSAVHLQLLGISVFFLIILLTKAVLNFPWVMGLVAAVSVMIAAASITATMLRVARKNPSIMRLDDFEGAISILTRAHTILCFIPIIGIWWACRPPKILLELRNTLFIMRQLDSRS